MVEIESERHLHSFFYSSNIHNIHNAGCGDKEMEVCIYNEFLLSYKKLKNVRFVLHGWN